MSNPNTNTIKLNELGNFNKKLNTLATTISECSGYVTKELKGSLAEALVNREVEKALDNLASEVKKLNNEWDLMQGEMHKHLVELAESLHTDKDTIVKLLGYI